ncbi:MAG: TolC family protein, partial [Gammaproteobacteria bacterium]|nr:TolC family protein [Gammaproteobacteria bacterium]
ILRLRQQVQSDQASFKRMDALHRVTRTKEVLGRTTRVDTLRVELLQGQALARLESSKERLDSTQRDFAELLGFMPDTFFELKPPPILEFDVPQSAECVKIALANRLDYAQALQDSEDAARGVRIARRKLLPDLNLIAGHSWRGDDPIGLDPARLEENAWYVGLSVDTDLNRTRERNALGQAGIDQSSAQQTVEIVERSIARQGQQHYLAYRRAQAEVKIANRNFDLAAARGKLARRLFEFGRGDNFSVTDAETAFLQAERQLLLARAEASISGYRLFRALGTLIEVPQELKPVPRLR